MNFKHLTVLISGLAIIMLSGVAARAGDVAGQVLAVKRDVFLIRAEGRDSAKPQMDLLIKDAVETAENSRTKLYFTDDSILNLGELSKVQVEQYLYSPEKQRSKAIYRLMEGAVKVVVGRSDLEVHTSSAVAAARGTKFIMWSRDIKDEQNQEKRKRQTCVMTLEGKVEFKLKKEAVTDKTKKDNVMVNEGTVSCVEGNDIEDVRPIDLKLKAESEEEFAVLAGDIPQKDELPAFAPPAGEPVVIPPDPIIPIQEPAITVIEPSPEGVNIEVLFPEQKK